MDRLMAGVQVDDRKPSHSESRAGSRAVLREESFIVKAVIRYFEKPEAGPSSPGRQMESCILSALHRYFDTRHG
jgi:hypothetical protein